MKILPFLFGVVFLCFFTAYAAPEAPDSADPFAEEQVNCAELAAALAQEAGPDILEAVGQLRNGQFVTATGISGNEPLIEETSSYINSGCDDATLEEAIKGLKKSRKGLFGLF